MSKTSGHSPYFCEDGLLVDPRPIGHWSIRWCPNEEFDFADDDREIEPDRLLCRIADHAENLRKWVSLGMKIRFEPGVTGSNPAFMFETTDPVVAARMVNEAGISWWRSSIFEVDFDDGEIALEAPDDFARADGFQLPPGINMRAHIIGSTDDEEDAEKLDSILETHGFELVCGAHGTYDWFISQQEMNTEQMHALEAEITAVQGISHCDIGPFDPSDICANPLCRPGPPEKPRRKKRRQPASQPASQPAKRIASEIAALFARQDHLRAKWEHADDPLVVELADAGLALLDAEVALHDAPLGYKARTAVEAAKQRIDRAMAALCESNKDEQTVLLRRWKRPSGKRLH